jgi:hypothetical protein
VHLSSPPSYSGVLAAKSLVFSLVLVEQELLTILVHLSSPPSYSGDLAAQSLVFSLVLVEQELLTIPVHLSSLRLIVGFLLLVLERKLKIEQQDPHYKTEGNSGAPEW